MIDSQIIMEARRIYKETFYFYLPYNQNDYYRSLSDEAFWQQIESLDRSALFSRKNYQQVADEASKQFQEWLKGSSKNCPFIDIDEKGQLYKSFRVTLKEESEWYWYASYIHPLTKEKVMRGPFRTIQLEPAQLNMKRPQDVFFFKDNERNTSGRLFAVPIED